MPVMETEHYFLHKLHSDSAYCLAPVLG